MLKETLIKKEKMNSTINSINLDDKENDMRANKANQIRTSNPKVKEYLRRRLNQVRLNAMSQ